MSKFAVKQFNETEIYIRSDGYFNATAMCRACERQWNHYFETQPTQEFIEALSLNTGIAGNKLIESKKGRYGGTWVHPQVAMHLGQWLSPAFAVACSQWIIERIEENSNPELAARRGLERAIEGWRQKGKDEKWISAWTKARQRGIPFRKDFTRELASHGCDIWWQFANCTDRVNEHLIGRKAKEFAAELDIPRNEVRNNLDTLTLAAICLAEEVAVKKLDDDKAQTYSECLRTCDNTARFIRQGIANALEVA